jgi:uncharacterized RDD family membrane protein YckC
MSAQWDPAPQQRSPVYASWGWRALALLVDGLVAFGFVFAFSIPLGVLGYAVWDEETLRRVIDYVSIPFTVAFLVLYFPLTMKRTGAHNGQTWGKQACGIRVVREDGLPVTAQTALQREVLLKYLVFWVASLFALLVPALANYLWPLRDPRNQTLHDKMVHTYVVKDVPVPVVTYASGWEPPVPPSSFGPVQ